MSATNHTTNYSLPQFIATDVPTWLVDINGAFSDIDTAIHNAAEAAGAASTLATTAKNKADAVETSLGTTNSNVSTLQGTVQTQQTAITANTTKIGSAALTTVAQNLSGAVNELKAQQNLTTDYTLLFNTSTEGTGTLYSDMINYRFLLVEVFATGVAYNTYMLPTYAVLYDTDMEGFKFMYGMNTGGTDRHIAFQIPSSTQIIVSDRSHLNLRLYGFN